MASCDRSHDQSWRAATDRTINRCVRRQIARPSRHLRPIVRLVVPHVAKSCDKSGQVSSSRFTERDVSRRVAPPIVRRHDQLHDQSLYTCIVIDDNDIERVTHAKVSGVTLSADLSWNAHVDMIVSKARKRVFTIYQLKRAGIIQCDLLRVSVIRPVLEYACPVWHTSLPMYLSDNIETIQKRCLRTILPWHSYDEARSISNLPTLFERRTKLCQSYFRKMHNADHKLNKLLPNQRYIPYGLRTHNTLPVPLARTDRFRRSLIPWGLANWQHNCVIIEFYSELLYTILIIYLNRRVIYLLQLSWYFYAVYLLCFNFWSFNFF